MNFSGSRLGFWFIKPASFSVTPSVDTWRLSEPSGVIAVTPSTWVWNLLAVPAPTATTPVPTATTPVPTATTPVPTGTTPVPTTPVPTTPVPTTPVPTTSAPVDPRANWVAVYGTQEEVYQVIFWRDTVTGQLYNYDGTIYVPFDGNSAG
jgi:hypothetical protein